MPWIRGPITTVVATVALICIFFQIFEISISVVAFAEAKSVQSPDPASHLEIALVAADKVVNLSEITSDNESLGQRQLFAKDYAPFSRLYRRDPPKFPTDQQFKDFTAKGCRLKGQLQDPSTAGKYATSQWTDYKSLAEWGWSVRYPDEINDYSNHDDPGFGDIIPAGVKGTQYNWEHNDGYKGTDPKYPAAKYPATGAGYQNAFYPTLGVIVGEYNKGPDYVIKEEMTPQEQDGKPWDPKVDNPPELKQWSDVVYLTWAHFTDGHPDQTSGLKWVCRRSVTNDDTTKIIAEVLKRNWPKDPTPGSLPVWPDAKKITPEMDGFEAVLGSPNVSGVMWLLIQHQKDMWKKQILSVTAYLPEADDNLNLNIEIGPAKDDGNGGSGKGGS